MGYGLVALSQNFALLLFQHRAEFAELLDHAVANHRDVVGGMGMSIAFGRLSVRGPARVRPMPVRP